MPKGPLVVTVAVRWWHADTEARALEVLAADRGSQVWLEAVDALVARCLQPPTRLIPEED